MCKHTGLAHAHDFSQRPNAQAFQANLRGQTQGGIHNGRFGLLALVYDSANGMNGRNAGGFARKFNNGHGLQIELMNTKQNKTNDRSILQQFANWQVVIGRNTAL